MVASCLARGMLFMLEQIETWLRRPAAMLDMTPKGLLALFVVICACIAFVVYTLQFSKLPYLTYP